MTPHAVSRTSATFYAKGRAWTIPADHPHFDEILSLLASGSDDVDRMIDLVDIRVAINRITEGRVILEECDLFHDGKSLGKGWLKQAVLYPESLMVLNAQEGDTIRVEGDEDIPDGDYVVAGIDEDDSNARLYVEDDCVLGFVSNNSVRSITRRKSHE